MQTAKDNGLQSRAYRTVTCAFGVFFMALALAIFAVSDVSLESLIATVLVGGLGLDAIVSALRDKKSLLARIGPLP